MSSSDSDLSECENDYFQFNQDEYYSPPLIKKKSRLIATVVQNQVGVLSDLLDSPRWYNVRDYCGYSLLQIAILTDKIEVFDYMLSIPDFPLDFVNEEGQTALVIALDRYVSHNDIWTREHFVYELIKKGACIDNVYFEGGTPLHCALDRGYYRAAKLLIERGADINAPNSQQDTPLTRTLCKKNNELMMTLLVCGAQPTVLNFEQSVLSNNSFEVQETLFLYIYDEYSNLELRLLVLLQLAEAKSPLFYHIIQCPIKITVQYEFLNLYFRILCSISIDCLHLVIQKCGHNMNKVFSRKTSSNANYWTGAGKVICLENLNVMLESKLRPSVLTFINNINSRDVFEDLIGLGYDETAITQFYCYLLGYGLDIGELDLHAIYRVFGYCELFKILLHMDIDTSFFQEEDVKMVVPVFVYDINMNVERFLEERGDYYADSIYVLQSYFVHPKLDEICYQTDRMIGYSKVQSFQEIPLLVELARNVFREFFVKKFNIQTCKEFYARLNGLPVSNVHKKIITYETELY
ncbi:hypothetical protein Zmor_024588 [Zophobas morio]|uniref:Uncharacterized protein n=1 Tax=Zophobas morio TaxID=2755281 RepID=A0AA38I0X7_9CUCU|nr:hypothetical protein Zmor_024588 [Zophobas morio]